MTRHPELPERDRRILAELVQAYIDQGEPVSSLWLASRGFGVSSATLRDVMARLEEQGYVRQPHTSPAAFPPTSGYRCYVDRMLSERRRSARLTAAGRSAAAPRRHRRGHALARLAGNLAGVASGRVRDCAGATCDVRAPGLRAARRRQAPRRRRRRGRPRLAQGDRAVGGVPAPASCSRPRTT